MPFIKSNQYDSNNSELYFLDICLTILQLNIYILIYIFDR